MPRPLKIALISIFASPLVAIGVWYTISFLPYLGAVRSIASQGSQSVRGIANVFYPLLAAAESNDAQRIYAMRQAYWSLVYEPESGGNLTWHTSNFLWYIASYIHFDERQIAGIWVECALSRCDGGLSQVARKYYAENLVHLSESELAALLGAVRSPTEYAPDQKAGMDRTKAILEKAKLAR
jgi:hypothetical protein